MGHVKIISDGTVSGTRIIDAETGKDIPGAYAFELKGSATKTTVDAVIYCHFVEADVTTAKVVRRSPPRLGRRRARTGPAVRGSARDGWVEIS